MRIHKAFIRCIVAVAAILTLAAAVAAEVTRTTNGGHGQIYNGTLRYKAINNTTTPTPQGGSAETQPEGLLIVDCNYPPRDHRVLKDTAKDITCLMSFGETDPFTYTVWVETTTAVIGRSHYSSEKHTSEIEWDCQPGEKMELTFTGSGKSITYSVTCTGRAYADMDDDP